MNSSKGSDIKINVQAKYNTVNVLTGEYRHPDPRPEYKVGNTDIYDPLHFIENANARQLHFPHPTLTFDHRVKEVTFCSDPFALEGKITITGVMKEPADLSKAKINSNTTFSKVELLNALKAISAYFVESSDLTYLVLGLEKFAAKVSVEIVDVNDNMGNKENARKQTLDLFQNIKSEFEIHAPVYSGLPPNVFKVNILVDYVGNEVRFRFDSFDILRARNEAFSKVIERYVKQVEGQKFFIINHQ